MNNIEKIKYERIEFNNSIIIKRTFYNTISINEIIDSFNYLVENEYNKENIIKVLITDTKEATFNFKFAEFRKMLLYIKNHSVLSEIQMAVIVDSPLKTVFPTLASSIIGIHVKPFSTLNAALNWAKSFSNT